MPEFRNSECDTEARCRYLLSFSPSAPKQLPKHTCILSLKNSNIRHFKNMLLNYPNGDSYDGAVITYNNNHVPHGHGKKTFSNGDVQTGNFFHGVVNGWGSFRSSNGDCYDGYYRDGCPDGFGESYQARNRRRYKGGFRRGIEDGSAVITTGENIRSYGYRRYEGGVRNGKRHGRGKLYLRQSDGEIASFEGMWVNDLMNGYGTQISPTGQCFNGNFVNGYLEGEGTCKNAEDGKTFDVIFTMGMVSKWIKPS